MLRLSVAQAPSPQSSGRFRSAGLIVAIMCQSEFKQARPTSLLQLSRRFSRGRRSSVGNSEVTADLSTDADRIALLPVWVMRNCVALSESKSLEDRVR